MKLCFKRLKHWLESDIYIKGCEHVTSLDACFNEHAAVWTELHKNTEKFYSFLQDLQLLLQAWETHKDDAGSDDIRSLMLCAVNAIIKSSEGLCVVLTLTLCCWTCLLVVNLWTSPSVSWPHWRLPSPQNPSCGGEPADKQQTGRNGDCNLRREKVNISYWKLNEITKAALCRHCQTETSAMPSGMAGNCPSLRLSTPASLSNGWI